MKTSNSKKQYSTPVRHSHQDFDDVIMAASSYLAAKEKKSQALLKLADLLVNKYGNVTSNELSARIGITPQSVRMIRIRKGGDIHA